MKKIRLFLILMILAATITLAATTIFHKQSQSSKHDINTKFIAGDDGGTTIYPPPMFIVNPNGESI